MRMVSALPYRSTPLENQEFQPSRTSDSKVSGFKICLEERQNQQKRQGSWSDGSTQVDLYQNFLVMSQAHDKLKMNAVTTHESAFTVIYQP